MLGQGEAIAKSPPFFGGGPGTEYNRPFILNVPISPGTSYVPCTILTVGDPAAIPAPGCFITWISDVDTYINVGTINANPANVFNFWIPANTMVDWWHRFGIDTHVSVRSKSGVAGTIVRYRSNQ